MPKGHQVQKRRFVHLFSEAIREYMTKEGLNQRQMGALLGVSPLTVWGIERGHQLPSLRTLRRAAVVFQWTPEDLGKVVMALPEECRMYYDDAWREANSDDATSKA